MNFGHVDCHCRACVRERRVLRLGRIVVGSIVGFMVLALAAVVLLASGGCGGCQRQELTDSWLRCRVVSRETSDRDTCLREARSIWCREGLLP